MNNNFHTLKLGKLGKISMCKRVLKEETSDTEEIPFYKISTFGGKPDTFISKKRYLEYKSKYSYPKKGDILISASGTIGKTVIFNDEDAYFQDSNIVWIDNNELVVRNDFLYYFYQTNPWTSTNGSTIKRLYNDDLRNIVIHYPDINEQQKIANVLSSLDSKIELNNKINKELEAIAKTLYDYWFVQFDFPDENRKPYKSSGGKMVYNQELKREIPEGWEVRTISQFIGNNKGGDWGKEQEEGNYTQKVSCIRGADLNGLNGLGELNPPERFILDKNSNKILESHDLIVEISGGSPTQSTGRLSFIIDETITRFENPLICSNFCKSFSLKNQKYLYYFIYMWNNLYDNSVLFGWEGKTSGIKNLLFDSFTQKYFIVVPEENINQKFYEKMDSFHKMKQKNLKENQELAKLRDWLLPMLMNGQVKVK